MSEHTPQHQPVYPTQQPRQAPAPGRASAQPRPLPDLARGFHSVVGLTHPVIGIVIPCVALFLIGAYGIGLAALAGLAGVSLMICLIGWLCLLAGVITSALSVRRMVANYPAAGSQFSVLLWLGLVLPTCGFLLMVIAPIVSPYTYLSGASNAMPMLGLFIIGIALVPAAGLAQAYSVRSLERSHGQAGISALWALQQGQVSREHEYLAGFAVQRPAPQAAPRNVYGGAPQQQQQQQPHAHQAQQPQQQQQPGTHQQGYAPPQQGYAPPQQWHASPQPPQAQPPVQPPAQPQAQLPAQPPAAPPVQPDSPSQQ